VLALARSDASTQSLIKAGVAVLRGDLDAKRLRAGAVQTEGVIHLAFGGDDPGTAGFRKSREAAAVETFGAALEGERECTTAVSIHHAGHPHSPALGSSA
jgi:hypothetical protein